MKTKRVAAQLLGDNEPDSQLHDDYNNDDDDDDNDDNDEDDKLIEDDDEFYDDDNDFDTRHIAKSTSTNSTTSTSTTTTTRYPREKDDVNDFIAHGGNDDERQARRDLSTYRALQQLEAKRIDIAVVESTSLPQNPKQHQHHHLLLRRRNANNNNNSNDDDDNDRRNDVKIIHRTSTGKEEKSREDFFKQIYF